MKIITAGLIVELYPKFEYFKRLCNQFRYDGARPADISLHVSDEYLTRLMFAATKRTDIEQMEVFAYGGEFTRAALRYETILFHASSLVYQNGAYLFSAASGVGKSTHTRLWLRAFGNKVHIMNDDKPALRVLKDQIMCCGTPFDGGSGIALNEQFPLKAIVFIERGENNEVRIPGYNEILQNLFARTAQTLRREDMSQRLKIFDSLVSQTRFFSLKCNMDISAAHVAFDNIIE